MGCGWVSGGGVPEDEDAATTPYSKHSGPACCRAHEAAAAHQFRRRGASPLLLIDLHTEEGVTGRSYLFGYQPFALKPLHDLVMAFAEMITGDRVAPFDVDRKLRSKAALLGPYNLLGMALAGLDAAWWDTLAVGQGLPLAELLGGSTTTVRGIRRAQPRAFQEDHRSCRFPLARADGALWG